MPYKNIATEDLPSVLTIRKQIEELHQRGIQLAWHFAPTAGMGGDSWGFRILGEDDVCVFTIDISGHGVEAQQNREKLHILLNSKTTFTTDPNIFLRNLNNRMVGLFPTGQFTTMFYGIIDLEKSVIKYSSAASPGGILIRSNGDVSILRENSFPLGIVPNAEYAIKEKPFASGDVLILYSDALIESPDSKNSFIAAEQLNSILAKNTNQSADGILQALVIFFKMHIGDRPADDDLTINIYKRL